MFKHKRSRIGVPRPWFGSSLIAFADGGGDGGGGSGGDDKTFTQQQVNDLLAKERKQTEEKFTAKLKDYDELKEKAGKVDDLEKRIAEIEEEKELAGKTAKEKEEARAAKERKTLLADKQKAEQERDEAVANLTKEQEAHRSTRVRNTLGLSLSKANVYSDAAEDALDAMVRASEFEFSDDGKIAGITLSTDGIKYDDPTKAAQAFLGVKKHFAAGTPGGTGTRPPTGGGTKDGKRPFERTSEERMARIAAQQSSE